jgi:glutathione S-transferase
MSPPLRILGKASSINVRKVLWTADELGLAYRHEADWGSPARPLDSPAFRALNPNGLVPVLVDGEDGVGAAGGQDGQDDGLVLWESNTLCRYLAACHGAALPTLLPADPAGRARVEQWMDWQLGELNPAWRPAFMALVRGVPWSADQVATSATHWGRLMALLDDQLARTGAWVAGDDFTLADIVLGLSANRWQHTPVDEKPGLPAIEAWVQRLKARPAARRWAFNGVP